MIWGKRSKKLKRRKKIGLALGGGAVLGAAHIGVLKAIEEYRISISYVGGTSIGALVGALFAFGKSWQEIRDVALNMSWTEISALTLSQYALLSNTKLGRLVKETIGDVRFDQAHIPLAMVATDIGSGQKIVMTEGDVASAVMASACIPGIFCPVERNGHLLVDGGLIENVPVSSVIELGAEITIGVNLASRQALKKPENIVGVLTNAFAITFSDATRHHARKSDFLITPDLSSFNARDTGQVPELIEAGYKAANELFNGVVK